MRTYPYDSPQADGESMVLIAAVEQWGLHREMLWADTTASQARHG